jgi:hypothetical protein
MVTVPLTVNVPVLNVTLSAMENCTVRLLGSEALQPPPPPVQDDAAKLFNVAATPRLGVTVPEQAVP